MTKKQYLQNLKKSLDAGKISEEAYDQAIINMDNFAFDEDDEESNVDLEDDYGIDDLFCITLNNMTKQDARLYCRTYGLVYRPNRNNGRGFDLAGDEDSVREMLEDYIGRYDEIGKIMNEGNYIPDYDQDDFIDPNRSILVRKVEDGESLAHKILKVGQKVKLNNQEYTIAGFSYRGKVVKEDPTIDREDVRDLSGVLVESKSGVKSWVNRYQLTDSKKVKDSSTPIEDLLIKIDNKSGITLDHAIDDLKKRKGYNDSLLGDNLAINMLMKRFNLEKRDVIRVLNYKFDGRYLKDKKVKDSDEYMYYGLFQKGGSIGQNSNAEFRKYPDGILLDVYLDREEAKAKAKRYRKSLTPGERSYYGMGYSVKPLSKSDLKHPYVQKLIAELNKDTNVKDSDPWHELAHYELTFEDGHKEKDTIPLYVKRDSSDEEILEYFQDYYDDKIVSVKQVGWSRMGDKKVKTKDSKDPREVELERIFKKLESDNLTDAQRDYLEEQRDYLRDQLNKSKKVRDSVQEPVSEGAKEALEEYTQWEGIIGYDEDIIECYESGCAFVDDEYIDYEDSYDALDNYLRWEGILGYTNAIYDILENGVESIYYDEMLRDKEEHED